MTKTIEHIESKEGNCPLVFISGHDGKWYLEGYHHSSSGEWCRGPPRDKFVNKIMFRICELMKKNYNKSPYYVLSNVRRAQLDMNRSKKVGTSSKLTRKIWNNYHDKATSFIKQCIDKYGYCLFFDMHGNSRLVHDIQLGYNVKDADMKNKRYNNSSLRPLSNYMKTSPEELMYGKDNLCNKIQTNGLGCVPNSIQKEDLQQYFSGGFNTRYFAKKFRNKPFGGIQVEIPKIFRTEKMLDPTAVNLAKSINEFTKQINIGRKKGTRKTRKVKK